MCWIHRSNVLDEYIYTSTFKGVTVRFLGMGFCIDSFRILEVHYTRTFPLGRTIKWETVEVRFELKRAPCWDSVALLLNYLEHIATFFILSFSFDLWPYSKLSQKCLPRWRPRTPNAIKSADKMVFILSQPLNHKSPVYLRIWVLLTPEANKSIVQGTSGRGNSRKGLWMSLMMIHLKMSPITRAQQYCNHLFKPISIIPTL